MTTALVERSSPLRSRLAAWSADRFPVGLLVVGTLPTFLAALAAGRLAGAGGAEGAALDVDLLDVAGFASTIFFLLVLRVFDEHKDYATDSIAHPDRVLQRGVITLAELRVLGVAAAAFQVVTSMLYDRGAGAVLAAWAIAFGWSCLMAVEFFCGEWLAARLLPYALTHTVVTPLATWWMFTMGSHDLAVSPVVWGLWISSFCGSLGFEIGRKSFAPADERPEVDSYSSRYGTTWVGSASAALVAVGTLGAILSLGAIQHGGDEIALPGTGWLVCVVLLGLASLPACVSYARNPTPSSAKALAGLCGLANLGAQTAIVVAVLVRGELWS